METLVKLVESLLKFLTFFFELNGGEDKYIKVGIKPSVGEKNVVPFGRADDIPYLGSDHKEKIEQAEQLFDDDELRYKWLVAVYRLRNTDTGWIIDESNKDKKFTKWGLTHLAC